MLYCKLKHTPSSVGNGPVELLSGLEYAMVVPPPTIIAIKKSPLLLLPHEVIKKMFDYTVRGWIHVLFSNNEESLKNIKIGYLTAANDVPSVDTQEFRKLKSKITRDH